MCYLRRWIGKKPRRGGVHHSAREELRERLIFIAVAQQVRKQSHGTGAIPHSFPAVENALCRRRGWSSLSISTANHSPWVNQDFKKSFFFFYLQLNLIKISNLYAPCMLYDDSGSVLVGWFDFFWFPGSQTQFSISAKKKKSTPLILQEKNPQFGPLSRTNKVIYIWFSLIA